MKYYLAIDIGASSGRHIIGYKENGELKLEEMYRFKNGVTDLNGHLTWDIDHLFKEIKEGIKICLAKYPHIESMSIDTWGVDYVLLKGDKEVYPCYAYRDNRTENAIKKVHELIPFERLYEITGSQFQPFTSIYQLYEDKMQGRLEGVTDFLHIPEYFMYKLTGVKKKEYTNASTTGMMDLFTNEYSDEIIEKLGLPKSLFPKTYKQGEVVGYLLPEIQKEVGGNLLVKLCSTHDTGAAVEGIPFKSDAPYISSGTWSLLGIKVDKGINSFSAMKANYSNEYGPTYIRFQKNIMGMWIVNELIKQFHKDLITLVSLCPNSHYKEIYDVNDPVFLASKDMKKEIQNWFKSRGIKEPVSDIDLLNSTYYSLARSYQIALDELEQITGKKFNELYIVGGGAKNQYLNHLTEQMTNRKVIALPIEATSIGNLLSQMEEK